jgi:hypothetical protein
MKPIRLSIHAREQLLYRGVSEEEVHETIRTSKWRPAALGRLECKKVFHIRKNGTKYIIMRKRLDLFL